MYLNTNETSSTSYLYQQQQQQQSQQFQQQQNYLPEQQIVTNDDDKVFKRPLTPVVKNKKRKLSIKDKKSKKLKEDKEIVNDTQHMDYVEIIEIPYLNKPKTICPKTGKIKSELEMLLEEPPHTVILKFNFQNNESNNNIRKDTPQQQHQHGGYYTNNIHHNMQIQNMISNPTSSTSPYQPQWNSNVISTFNDAGASFDGFIDTSNFLSNENYQHDLLPTVSTQVNDFDNILFDSNNQLNLFDFSDFQFI